MIEEIKQVAVALHEPMLFMGPTGARKFLLVSEVFELKRGGTNLHSIATQYRLAFVAARHTRNW